MTAKVKLADALCAVSVEVDALDGRKFGVPIEEIVQYTNLLLLVSIFSPGFKKELEGEGMPSTKSNAKGKLTILFDIIFPKQLSSDAKKQILKILA